MTQEENGEILPRKEGHLMTDYFADRLLTELPSSDPIQAAFDAQDVSRTVGFDFKNFQDTVPRALDELRETREAFQEAGPAGREHFGDEIADIMFSLVNLTRHAGNTEFGSLNDYAHDTNTATTTLELVDQIESGIKEVAAIPAEQLDEIKVAMEKYFSIGMSQAIKLAIINKFDPETILKANVEKYLLRCKAIETLAAQDGKQWADLAREGEIVDYWKRAKTILS